MTTRRYRSWPVGNHVSSSERQSSSSTISPIPLATERAGVPVEDQVVGEVAFRSASVIAGRVGVPRVFR
jgi:hypothetical protein